MTKLPLVPTTMKARKDKHVYFHELSSNVHQSSMTVNCSQKAFLKVSDHSQNVIYIAAATLTFKPIPIT